MKLKLLLFILTVTTHQFAYSQFSLGVEAGANFANVKFEGLDGLETKSITQWFSGISPKYTLGEQISILADVNYSRIGFQNDLQGATGAKFRCTYLVFAPQIAYKVANSLGVNAGFYTGFKIDEEEKIASGEWFSSDDFETIKSGDFGMLIGIRAFYKKAYLKLAYLHGLQNITNLAYTDNNGELIDVEISNRNLQLGIGYLIGFESK